MKQETTLEEVANEYAKNRYSPEQGFPEEDYYISFLSFRAGAKWQAERSYSEEDMKDYAEYYNAVANPKIPKDYFKK